MTVKIHPKIGATSVSKVSQSFPRQQNFKEADSPGRGNPNSRKLDYQNKNVLKVFFFSKFNSVIVNEQEISRTVVYHFKITLSRRASKIGLNIQGLHGCISLFRNKILQGVHGHVQKYGPHP